MGEANENRTRSNINLSFQIDKYPRDLLQRFMSAATDTQQSQNATPSEEETEEEIELNLGLSLGGQFGVDKNPKKLTRSSSIAGTMPIFRDDDTMIPPTVPYPILMRTSSLPTETEEEWRKRKEMQMLRRMEAKRRRSEKQRNSSTNNLSANKTEVNLEDESSRQRGTNAVSFELPSWAVGARQEVIGSGKGGFLQQQSSQQGSPESQGGGSSSSMSELESKPLQGSSSCEARSPASTQSLQEHNNHGAGGASGTKTNESASRSSRPEIEKPSKKPDSVENRGKEIGMNAMEDMPCVFTKGDGPNGRRIEGILYKYGKGEEVRIMCVCHGSFLSPAEFVKHAGGGDVDHPLRHIVVNPSANSF